MSSGGEESGVGSLPRIYTRTQDNCGPMGDNEPLENIQMACHKNQVTGIVQHIKPPNVSSVQPHGSNASAWISKARGNTKKKPPVGNALGSEASLTPRTLKPPFSSRQLPVKLEETSICKEEIATDGNSKYTPNASYKTEANQPKIEILSHNQNPMLPLSTPPGFELQLGQNSKGWELKAQPPSLLCADLKVDTNNASNTKNLTSDSNHAWLRNMTHQSYASLPQELKEPQCNPIPSSFIAQPLPNTVLNSVYISNSNLGISHDHKFQKTSGPPQIPSIYNNLQHYVDAHDPRSFVNPIHANLQIMQHQALEQYMIQNLTKEKEEKPKEVNYEMPQDDQDILHNVRLSSMHVQSARTNAIDNKTSESSAVSTSLQSTACQSVSLPSPDASAAEKKRKSKKNKNKKKSHKDEQQSAGGVHSSEDGKDRTQKKPLQKQEKKRENSDECRHSSQTNTRPHTDSHCRAKKVNQQTESTPSVKHFNSDSYSIEHAKNTETSLSLPASKLSEQKKFDKVKKLSKAPKNSTEMSRKQKIEQKSTIEEKSESTLENSCMQENVLQEEKAHKSSPKVSVERFYIPPGYRYRLDAQEGNVMEARIEPTETKSQSNSQEAEQIMQKKLDGRDIEQPEECHRKMHHKACNSSHDKPQVESAGKGEPQRIESVKKSRGFKNKNREKQEKAQPKQHSRHQRFFSQGDNWKTRQLYNDNMTEGNNVKDYRSQEPLRHKNSTLSSGKPLNVSDYQENQQFDGPCNQYKPENPVFEDNRTRNLTTGSKKNIAVYNNDCQLVKPSFRKDNNYSQNSDINPGTQHYPSSPLAVAFASIPPPGFSPLNVPVGCLKSVNPPPGLNPVNHSPRLNHVNPPPGLNPVNHSPRLNHVNPPPGLNPVNHPRLNHVNPPPGLNPLNHVNLPPGLNPVNHSLKLNHVNPPPGFNTQYYQMIPAEIKITQTEHCTESQPTSKNQYRDNSAKVIQSETKKSLAGTSTSKTASMDSKITEIQTQNSEKDTTAPATDSATVVQSNKIQVIDYWDCSVVEKTVDVDTKKEKLPEEVLSLKFIEEINGDLFCAPPTCSLVHCVAEDMRMSQGIAVEFRRRYYRIAELLNQYARTGELAVLPEPKEEPIRFIYYLVTKSHSMTSKPNIDSLESSLVCLREHCIKHQVKHLAMPRIGCGLDLLLWPNVVTALKKVFANTGIKITVYNMQTDFEKLEKLDSSMYHLTLLDDPNKSLSDMQNGTARIFLANEGPRADTTMKELNVKFNFLHTYTLKPRTMGELFCFESKFPKEILYGLVVRAQAHHKIDYVALETALKALSKALKKEKYLYIAFEAFYDKNDPVAVDKVVTLMKWMLGKNGVQLRICWPSEVLMSFNSCSEIEPK